MYKITWNADRFSYLLKRAVVHCNREGRVDIYKLDPGTYTRCKRVASIFGTLDKVLEPERKMFWLCYGEKLRTMGVIR